MLLLQECCISSLNVTYNSPVLCAYCAFKLQQTTNNNEDCDDNTTKIIRDCLLCKSSRVIGCLSPLLITKSELNETNNENNSTINLSSEFVNFNKNDLCWPEEQQWVHTSCAIWSQQIEIVDLTNTQSKAMITTAAATTTTLTPITTVTTITITITAITTLSK